MDEIGTRRGGRHGVDPILAAAIAGGASHAEAARAANVSVRTITRRLADPSFRAQIDDIQARSFEGIASELMASTPMAIEALRDLLGPEHPATVRVNAARALTSATLQYRSAPELREARSEPADTEDLETKKQHAMELVDELKKRREIRFQANHDSGHVPPDPPSCIDDHTAGECDGCVAWQEAVHASVLEHSIDAEGCLTEVGSWVRG